jgi:hypothetical protein
MVFTMSGFGTLAIEILLPVLTLPVLFLYPPGSSYLYTDTGIAIS